MHKFGVAVNWISIIACVVGLVMGFRDLVVYGENSVWLAMVPASFLGLLTGVVITLFSKR